MTQVTLDFVRQCLPIRARDGHKGTFGKVHILAGSVGFTGAQPCCFRRGAYRVWLSLSMGRSCHLARSGSKMPICNASTCSSFWCATQ